MALCELCGRPNARYVAIVAGTKALVCEQCASLGKVVEEVQESKPVYRPKKQEKRLEEEVVEDIGEIVRTKREEMGLKQEDLGRKINEPESLIRRIEHGFIPPVSVAKKLQRVLGVRLVEVSTQTDQQYQSKTPSTSLTLGDVIVVKKK